MTPIVTSYLETGSRVVHKCFHTVDKTGQNCSVSSISRTTENCLQLLLTLFTPLTRQDETRQSCPVGVGGVNYALELHSHGLSLMQKGNAACAVDNSIVVLSSAVAGNTDGVRSHITASDAQVVQTASL